MEEYLERSEGIFEPYAPSALRPAGGFTVYTPTVLSYISTAVSINELVL